MLRTLVHNRFPTSKLHTKHTNWRKFGRRRDATLAAKSKNYEWFPWEVNSCGPYSAKISTLIYSRFRRRFLQEFWSDFWVETGVDPQGTQRLVHLRSTRRPVGAELYFGIGLRDPDSNVWIIRILGAWSEGKVSLGYLPVERFEIAVWKGWWGIPSM